MSVKTLQRRRGSLYARLPVICRHVTSWLDLHSACSTARSTSDTPPNLSTRPNRELQLESVRRTVFSSGMRRCDVLSICHTGAFC